MTSILHATHVTQLPKGWKANRLTVVKNLQVIFLGKNINLSTTRKKSTNFFKVTFWFPKLRSLKPWKGHFWVQTSSLWRIWYIEFWEGVYGESWDHQDSSHVLLNIFRMISRVTLENTNSRRSYSIKGVAHRIAQEGNASSFFNWIVSTAISKVVTPLIGVK